MRALAAGQLYPQPEPQRHPDRGGLLRGDYSDRGAAADPAHRLPGRTERRVLHRTVHRHLLHLRHRPDPGGHVDPVDAVRSGGHPDHDPVGRSGLHDGHHPRLLRPPPAYWPVGAAYHGVHPQPQRHGRGGAGGAPRPHRHLRHGDGGGGAHVGVPHPGVRLPQGHLARRVPRSLLLLQRGL